MNLCALRSHNTKVTSKCTTIEVPRGGGEADAVCSTSQYTCALNQARGVSSPSNVNAYIATVPCSVIIAAHVFHQRKGCSCTAKIQRRGSRVIEQSYINNSSYHCVLHAHLIVSLSSLIITTTPQLHQNNIATVCASPQILARRQTLDMFGRLCPTLHD